MAPSARVQANAPAADKSSKTEHAAPVPIPGTKLRVLSCIPGQTYTVEQKWDWIDKQAKAHKPDLFVTPQEYLGGVQTMFFKEAASQPLSFTPQQILEPALRLAKKHSMAIAIGAVVDCPELNERRERIYVVDPDRGMTGYSDKFALPAYDDYRALGKPRLYPELNLENRAKAFYARGAYVGLLFCWEVYSNYVWHALCRAQPDMVLSMIKFGVKGWPSKGKDPNTGESTVEGFGFGGDGGWIDRLHMASKYDVMCPIVCSTNSWNLPNRSAPLAGVIYPYKKAFQDTLHCAADAVDDSGVMTDEEAPGGRPDTLYHPAKGTRGTIVEHVQVDEIDYLYWRYMRDNKMRLFSLTGQWMPSEAREMTMQQKIQRMQRKAIGLPKLYAESVEGKPEAKVHKAEVKRAQKLIFGGD